MPIMEIAMAIEACVAIGGGSERVSSGSMDERGPSAAVALSIDGGTNQMKVAITSTGTTLEAPMDPRFGRCKSFLLVETDDMSVEVIDNLNSSLGSGAGIQSAQLVARHGAKAVLTGRCGPNARETIREAGIELFVGCQGNAIDAVERFKSGQLIASRDSDA
jgi:predicted Fe-Mo cluster-binding NifX family protein